MLLIRFEFGSRAFFARWHFQTINAMVYVEIFAKCRNIPILNKLALMGQHPRLRSSTQRCCPKGARRDVVNAGIVRFQRTTDMK